LNYCDKPQKTHHRTVATARRDERLSSFPQIQDAFPYLELHFERDNEPEWFCCPGLSIDKHDVRKFERQQRKASFPKIYFSSSPCVLELRVPRET
jgi:hypothetical protein